MAEQAFDGPLDMIKASARGINSINYEIFYRNFRASIANALYYIEASDAVTNALKGLDRAAKDLTLKGSSLISNDNSEEVKEVERLVDDLRNLMRQCPPSAIARALGLA